MRDVLDVHTHTLASGHAYSTIWEMARAAKEKGLALLGITEHAPRTQGSCQPIYFLNLKVLPEEIEGIRVLHGVELNILNENGEVDLPEFILREMELGIASMHSDCFCSGTREYNTRSCIQAMKNPYVNILGHPDDGNFPVDYELLVKAAKEYHVLLEVNNNSLKPGSFRKDTRKNDAQMLRLCKEMKVPVIMSSDAHVHTDVGRHERALALLEELDFPEELVANRSTDALMEYINCGKREH